MKTLSTFCLALLTTTMLFGQTSGGPDTYGYTWVNSNHSTSPPVFDWFDITTIGTLVNGLGDDNFSGPVPIPGGFPYYWYNVNEFWIGSNGYISFQPGNISSAFPASMGLPAGVNDWIGIMTSDLNFAGAGNPGECYYYINSDTICVSYIDVPFWSSVAASGYTGSNTFQVILSKVDSSITFNYLSTSVGVNSNNIDDVIGIENNSGGIGLTALTDSLPPANLTIRFDYPNNVTYQAIDAGVNWNDNPANGGKFVSRYGTTSLTTNIKNFGNTDIGTFSVDNVVENPGGVTVTSGTLNIPSLPRDSDTIVVFSNGFTPTVVGTHTFNTSINLPTDVGPTNNTLDQEIIALDTSALMKLNYSDGTSSGTINWTGGNGGGAIYVEPPVYPVRIVSSEFYITANTGNVGFHAVIYDDDGPNGGPGTVLDSVFEPATSVNTGSYNTVPASNSNILINDGGVYLYWKMGGANISLGTDNTPPFSRRTYEILFGSWAPYRNINTIDFLMGLNVYYPIPDARFNIDPTQEPEISFTDVSTNDPTDWRWDFGDGSPVDITQHPTHTYTERDTFNVCLKVSNFVGSDSICRELIILKIPPVAGFVVNSNNAPTIAFSDTSTNDPTAWHWDFGDEGDSDTANTQNATYTYQKNGIYEVCLTAFNEGGWSLPTCQNVEIGGIGIEETAARKLLKIYPNPVSGSAFIELEKNINSEQLSLKVFTVKGEELTMHYEVVQGGIRFHSNHLSSGSYFFEVYDAREKVGMGKFMVK